MRIVVGFLIILGIFFLLHKALGLYFKGELFQPGAFKKSLHETGRTFWQGMKMFVILWILYLLLVYWLRNHNK